LRIENTCSDGPRSHNLVLRAEAHYDWALPRPLHVCIVYTYKTRLISQSGTVLDAKFNQNNATFNFCTDATVLHSWTATESGPNFGGPMRYGARPTSAGRSNGGHNFDRQQQAPNSDCFRVQLIIHHHESKSKSIVHCAPDEPCR